jgi:hypothetical protein
MQNTLADVCAATASYAVNMLPEWLKLPASGLFQRLEALVEGAILAHRDAMNNWGMPEPSRN